MNNKPTKGYYSILQFVPDLERAEGANIGVLLFCPETNFLKIKTANGNDRARRLFGHDEQLDLIRLNAFKESFEERVFLERKRIITIDDFKHFIDTRANQLLLTQPHPVKVYDAETELQRLFQTLVGGRHRSAQRTRNVREGINKKFDDLLIQRGINDKVRRNVTVEIPLLDRVLTFPFAYQNGRPNLVQTVVFDSSKKVNINQACQLAVEGKDLQERPENYQLNVLASLNQDEPESREHVQAVLDKFDVSLHTTNEIDKFVDYIAQTAHL